MAIATLAEAYGKKMSEVQIKVYDERLASVPIPLLNAAVRKAIDTRDFFPKIAELKADAETCRHELIAAHPYTACAECNFTGWLEDEGGARRCACWQHHQTSMRTLGILGAPVSLPPAFDARMARIGEAH